MIKMEKKTLLLLTGSFINQIDGESYQSFTELFLCAIGATDIDGNLTEEYVNSPFWKVEDGYLKPAAIEVAEKWQKILSLADAEGKSAD